ncbi:MAG: RNA polymerase sigma factor [Bacteroidetes bacterium]|nr:RNA polymerase sigma factor [Bacteroidota bacterium]
MEFVSKEIIAKCIARDRRAQAELHEHCFHLIMPLCYKYVRQKELARELFNQSFVKIIFSLDKYDDEKCFKKWSQSIAINTLIDEYRKKERLRKVIDSSIELESREYQHSTYSENSGLRQLENEQVEKILQKVPPVSRKVFSLFALEGFSHQEISELLKMSTGTSKWHVSNAREILKKYVAGLFTILLFLK